jgi:mono/diheme cytochrome c family protein
MTLRHLCVIALPPTLAAAFLFSPQAVAQDAPAVVGDPDRGRIVYQRVGYCVNCHGWAGDGNSGISMHAPVGANLRETKLDAEGLAEVIRCGIPGTGMPYHESAAYRDDRCYGQVRADFEEGTVPVRGKTFRDRQLADLVAYLQVHMIGFGKPNYNECADYFGPSADKSCGYLKTE